MGASGCWKEKLFCFVLFCFSVDRQFPCMSSHWHWTLHAFVAFTVLLTVTFVSRSLIPLISIDAFAAEILLFRLIFGIGVRSFAMSKKEEWLSIATDIFWKVSFSLLFPPPFCFLPFHQYFHFFSFPSLLTWLLPSFSLRFPPLIISFLLFFLLLPLRRPPLQCLSRIPWRVREKKIVISVTVVFFLSFLCNSVWISCKIHKQQVKIMLTNVCFIIRLANIKHEFPSKIFFLFVLFLWRGWQCCMFTLGCTGYVMREEMEYTPLTCVYVLPARTRARMNTYRSTHTIHKKTGKAKKLAKI